VLLDQGGDLDASERRRHREHVPPHQRRDGVARRGEQQVADVEQAHELAVAIGNVEVVERLAPSPAQRGDRRADR
jgi:hypothetical protein